MARPEDGAGGAWSDGAPGAPATGRAAPSHRPPDAPPACAGDGEAPVSRLVHRHPARRTGQSAGRQVVTLTCFRMESLAARLAQVASMAPPGRGLARTPGMGFGRVMGTGTGEGFDPKPETRVWTILATWDDMAAARAGIAEAPGWARRRARSVEDCTLFMVPLRATGRWGGVAPFEAGPAPAAGLPLAVLTRATVRLAHARAFWSRVPAINRQIAAGPGMLFRLGMGEVPLLHQVTFSVWQDAETMREFAYRGAGHRRAIADVRAGDWFAEELYARFAVLETAGRWQGRAPLG